ncbi:sterile alpha motif domain-containing protein 9-like [Denticeps clupeoides]|uniref:SAM domain-containing protein n=1 Tax=Denticeps clupeoides TaxID=299321 RepID=A0AAY4C7J0_9TELE|nr:sterile alpha motif domain-containing protein 9-like [Denticeps clupeoides]
MDEPRTTEDDGQNVPAGQLPAEIKSWTAGDVRQWILGLSSVDSECADALYNQKITGESLLLLDKSDLKDVGIELGPSKIIIHKRDELIKLKEEQLNAPGTQSGGKCKPYPFIRFHEAYRYRENSSLDVPESGPSNLIEPCHEFKAYINTENATKDGKMKKFTDEVIRFGAACMNCRSNGTIHFGVGDKPDYTHGQILGTSVDDTEAFGNALIDAIEGHFEHKHVEAAKRCIKPPRFVEVLRPDMTSAEKYVIEVDIEPASTVCEESFYSINNMDTRKSRKKKQREANDNAKECKFFYIRDGSSSVDLFAQDTSNRRMEKYNKYVAEDIPKNSTMRKEAEEKHLTVVKNSVQGSKLCEMITGASHSLDKSHFERYVLVANKSHPVQLESLAFLREMDLTAVLDFDPESEEKGLKQFFEDRNTNVHTPAEYKITEAVEDLARKLKLTRITSWVFCNGVTNREDPSDIDSWLTMKGSSIRDVISFLCRGEVLPPKKFLVIFLLLSDVCGNKDPMLEAFNMFLQELRGTGQVLCICENERSFLCWRDLIETRYGVNISERCIYKLSFAEINGTVLSLWSNNRRSIRFLPCGGGSKVIFTKKVEGSLDTLSVLCVNQCDGGSDDKALIEERFYKGGKVSWWNFYFSEQPGSMPFIKRDKFAYILETIIPDLCSLRKACVLFNVQHLPGCGGSTLAMHVLWELKDKFRCAVLKDKTADKTEIARQVVQLLTYETTKQSPPLPVLLMIDDFEDKNTVCDLQQTIEEECLKKILGFKSPQVIILNCMRAEVWEQTEATANTVFIGNKLSEQEQRLFQTKLEEIEKIYKNAETFYGFMILKKNFSPDYIRGVAKNTLKNFNLHHKQAQLIAVMFLLDFYGNSAKLSVPLCETFLGLQTQSNSTSCKVEDGFGKFATILTRCVVQAKVVFEAVRVFHPSMAEHCLDELTHTYSVSKAEIINLLLTEDKFYECIQGKEKLMQDVHNMLVRRCLSWFSPLIEAISNETPGSEETVLFNAAKRFEKHAVIAQLLSRYHYIKKKNFTEAKEWAKQARELEKDNSYICDTSAQVLKHELRHAITNDKDDPIKPHSLGRYLKMAESATDAFRQTQAIAKKENAQRLQSKGDYSPYNTAGCLGEVQVGVIVIELLEKIPVFSLDQIRQNILSRVLSGSLKIQNVCANDTLKHKHVNYYHVLQEFTEFLSNLKVNIRKQFDFLDCFFVNLGQFFDQKDIREARTQQELFSCFKRYVDFFCKTDASDLIRNKNLHDMLKARTFLEKNKADTYSGLLQYLSKTNSGPIMENIVCQYYRIRKICCSLRDDVNLIYACVVLSVVKPESQHKMPYNELIRVLGSVLGRPIPQSENLAVHFIAVVLLWPDRHSVGITTGKLRSYLSQLKSTFTNEMKSVYNGKRPVAHFYLGKKQGYDRLICRKDIEKCVEPDQNTFQWENGKIWKHGGVRQLLYRVEGEVKDNYILADTADPEVKVEVSPLFKKLLTGRGGHRVSFFVGFTIKGPVAIDIE